MADYIVAILLGVVLAKSNQMSQKNLKYNTNTKGMDSDMKKKVPAITTRRDVYKKIKCRGSTKEFC